MRTRSLLALVLMVVAPSARAVDLLGGGAPDRVLPVGSAAPAAEGGIELTPDALWQAGGIFWGCPLVIGPDAAFVVRASVSMGGETGSKGADGIAIVLHAHPKGPLGLGKVGGEMGFGGLAPGLAAELDTWHNPSDPNDNHVAWVATGGAGRHYATATPPFDLNDGGRVDITIVYAAGVLTMTVRAATGSEVSLVFPGDPASVLGDRAYVGVLAGTGAARNRHLLTSWSLELAGQPDTDGDGTPDTCDPDDDEDGVLDGKDVCPTSADPDQADTDQDGLGDACDPDPSDGAGSDADLDGVSNAEEAGRTDPKNPDCDSDTIADGDEYGPDGPLDHDGDGLIDPLDADADGDGVLDLDEAGDLDLMSPPRDSDGDGAPDFLDADSDGDGIGDLRDVCRTVANPDQLDSNHDGVGDACAGGEGASALPADLDGDAPGGVGGSARVAEAGTARRPGTPTRTGAPPARPSPAANDRIGVGARPPPPGQSTGNRPSPPRAAPGASADPARLVRPPPPGGRTTTAGAERAPDERPSQSLPASEPGVAPQTEDSGLPASASRRAPRPQPARAADDDTPDEPVDGDGSTWLILLAGGLVLGLLGLRFALR